MRRIGFGVGYVLSVLSDAEGNRVASHPVSEQIMADKLSKERRALLVRMESILGNECYNGNIQNYGPGGVREAAGRSFRYPVMLRDSEGGKSKVRTSLIPPAATDDMVRSGYYAFGANQLDVMVGLEKILQYLEKHHGLVVATSINGAIK